LPAGNAKVLQIFPELKYFTFYSDGFCVFIEDAWYMSVLNHFSGCFGGKKKVNLNPVGGSKPLRGALDIITNLCVIR